MDILTWTGAKQLAGLLSYFLCDLQELVEVVGRSSGVVLMAPPHESAEAAASVSTLLSTLKSKQKVSRASSGQISYLLTSHAMPFPG